MPCIPMQRMHGRLVSVSDLVLVQHMFRLLRIKLALLAHMILVLFVVLSDIRSRGGIEACVPSRVFRTVRQRRC